MQALTYKQIVAQLDKYIVGQTQAKRAVAVAVRNRWRRQQLSDDIRQDVAPKNILMIGPGEPITRGGTNEAGSTEHVWETEELVAPLI